MSARLDIRDLAVAFGDRIGLTSVSVTVDGGDCVAVLGASGSGKSSLLRTLAGLQPAARGTIRVDGVDVSALEPERRGIVYLHQEPVLFPHLSVLENVAFPLVIRRVPSRDARRRAADMLARLQVADVAANRPDVLSGGQRHRVALARALCADPAVLLLDEPLSSLDPVVRGDVRAALLEARRVSGAATLLVTHDLDDALAVATHLAAIGRSGDLSAPAAPAELLRRPPTLAMARSLGVFAECRGVVEQGDGAFPRFRWIGGVIDAPDAVLGAAIACVRAHEVEVLTSVIPHVPVLTVTGRRDAAHEVVLEVRDASGDVATVRAPASTVAQLGDGVQVELRVARIFPST